MPQCVIFHWKFHLLRSWTPKITPLHDHAPGSGPISTDKLIDASPKIAKKNFDTLFAFKCYALYAQNDRPYERPPKGVFFVVWKLHCKGRISLAPLYGSKI